MKKFLVLTLTVVFILSLSAIAAASTFDPYVGGEFQIIYAPDDTNAAGTGLSDDAPVSVGGDGTYSRFKSYVTGRVEDKDTNTWAKIGCKFTIWNNPNAPVTGAQDSETASFKWDAVYEGGIKQIGGVLDIWYTNDENGNTKRGQIPLNTPVYKFGGDPGFSDGQGNVFGFDYNKDAVAVNLMYAPNKTATTENLMAIAGTYKLNDSSNVWGGYRTDADKTKKYGVGGQMGVGFGTVACDLIAKTPDGGDTGSYIQGNVNLKALKLDITALLDNKYFFVNDGGMGVGVVYNVTDKLYVGGKTVFANDDLDEGSNVDDYYVGYKFGVFDSRVGFGTRGAGDSFVYATAHAGMW